jgi:glycosyltransferase involved in cell wall biosynthesis
MLNIRISIVTVVYNGVKTIERTIKSVLEKQSYENIEYIIIDGGSTDGTIDIIKKYEDRLAYWHSKKDKGIYDAMNIGISKTSGEYIILVNADDWLETDIVKKVVEVIKVNSYIDILHGNVNYIKENNPKVYKPKLNFSRFLWHGMAYYHPTFFVNKRVYEDIKFDTNYRLLSDYKFTMECIKKGLKFYYLDTVISNYSADGASAAFWKRIVEGHKIRQEYGYNILLIYISSFIRISKTLLGLLKNKLLGVQK